jgi:hypothetical protein
MRPHEALSKATFIFDDEPLAGAAHLLNEAEIAEKEGLAQTPIAVREPPFQFRGIATRNERRSG